MENFISITVRPALFTLQVWLWIVSLSAQAQLLDSTWHVKIDGKVVIVNPDGSFRLSNLSAPDTFGALGPGSAPDFLGDDLVRLVGQQVGGAANRYLFSEFFRLQQRQTISVTNLTFSDIPPRKPESLTFQNTDRVVRTGEDLQLQVMGRFADAETTDVTPRTSWTSYRLSNPNLARISGDGLIRGVLPGTVYVTAVNEGATAVGAVTVVDAADPLMRVVGMVVDEQGNPVEGARIVVDPLGSVTATTNANGEFELPELPTLQGALRVRVSHGSGTDLQCAIAEIPMRPALVADLGSLTLRPVPLPTGPNLLVWWSADLGLRDGVGTNDMITRGTGKLGDGIIGQGFDLSDGSSYFEASLAGPYAISNQLSVAAWIRPSSLDGELSFVSQYDSSRSQLNWYFSRLEGRLSFGTYLTGNPRYTQFRRFVTADPVLTAQQWHFVAASVDLATGEVRMFADGMEVPHQMEESSPTPWSVFNETKSPIRIGADILSRGNPAIFSGWVDEVCLWNRAITPLEVERLYRRSCLEPAVMQVTGRLMDPDNQPVAGARISITSLGRSEAESDSQGRFLLSSVPTGKGPITITAQATFGGVVFCANAFPTLRQGDTQDLGTLALSRVADPAGPGLLAWWSADRDLRDGAGTNDLIFVGVGSLGRGPIGSGFGLPGNGTHLLGAPLAENSLSNQMTISAWVNPQVTVQEQTIAGQYEASTQRLSWWFALSDRKLVFGLRETGGYVFNFRGLYADENVVQPNTWQFMTCTVDLRTWDVRLYVNGERIPATFSETTTNRWTTFNQTGSPVRLGAWIDKSGRVAGNFQGSLDEVTLWNRALTPMEVGTLFQRGCHSRISQPDSLAIQP